MKFKDVLITTLVWIWQFPQNLLAVFLEGILCFAANRGVDFYGKSVIFSMCIYSAMSLGNYIFINPYYSEEDLKNVMKHEYGHCIQSLLLGPLYLFIIGIPSILHSIIHGILGRIGLKWDYNKFYTEKWANYLSNKFFNVLKMK